MNKIIKKLVFFRILCRKYKKQICVKIASKKLFDDIN